MTPREWLAKQDQSLFTDLARLVAQKPKYTVQLATPKFEAHYEDSLLNELTALGMGIAFDPDQADFSQMNEQHNKDLYISEVKHKTFFSSFLIDPDECFVFNLTDIKVLIVLFVHL